MNDSGQFNPMYKFENKYKGTKQGIVNSFLDVLPLLQERNKKDQSALCKETTALVKEKNAAENVRPCGICGEASNQETCQACRMKEIIKNEQ